MYAKLIFTKYYKAGARDSRCGHPRGGGILPVVGNGFIADVHLLKNIFLIEEAYFTRNGVMNFHNLHVWS